MNLTLQDKILEKDELIKYRTLSHFTNDFGTEPRRLTEDKFAYLIIYVKQGNGNCRIDTDEIPLRPGSIIMVNPFEFSALISAGT